MTVKAMMHSLVVLLRNAAAPELIYALIALILMIWKVCYVEGRPLLQRFLKEIDRRRLEAQRRNAEKEEGENVGSCSHSKSGSVCSSEADNEEVEATKKNGKQPRIFGGAAAVEDAKKKGSKKKKGKKHKEIQQQQKAAGLPTITPLVRAFAQEVKTNFPKLLEATEDGASSSSGMLRRFTSTSSAEDGGVTVEITEEEQLLYSLAILVPKHYERLGHVVIAKLNAEVDIQEFTRFAEPFAKAMKGTSPVDVVVVDTEGIAGELRIPVHKIVWCKEETAASFGKCVVGRIVNKNAPPPAAHQKASTASPTKKKISRAQEQSSGSPSAKQGKEPQWTSLQHDGIIFPPPYEPHGVPVKYEGEYIHLAPEEEEVATMFAEMLSTDYARNPTFRANFFKDWVDVLEAHRGDANPIKCLELCDFSDIAMCCEQRKAERREQRKAAKANNKGGKNAKRAMCLVDGKETTVLAPLATPPGLFRGRGQHPKMGCLKKRLTPRDVTINIGENDTIPVPHCMAPGATSSTNPEIVPMEGADGSSWGSIVANQDVCWLAKYTENVANSDKCCFFEKAKAKKLRGGNVCEEAAFVPPKADSAVLAAQLDEEPVAVQDACSPLDALPTSVRRIPSPYILPEEVDQFQSYADSLTFTTHVENNIKYSFDAMKVMFSSGNTTERFHFSTIRCPGPEEVVVDMFAGIGYFTLPIAKHSGLKVLYALEKNPDSCAFLKINAFQNGVAEKLEVRCGDNRSELSDDLVGRCNRVMMGYIPCCKEFLPRAVSFLKTRSMDSDVMAELKTLSGSSVSASNGNKSRASPKRGTSPPANGDANAKDAVATKPSPTRHFDTYGYRIPQGILHYHFLADRVGRAAYSAVHSALVEELGEAMVPYFQIRSIRQVKSYAPKRYHHVADVVFGKKLAQLN